MDGMLGKRALGLLHAVMGRRDPDGAPTSPDQGPDVVEQAMDRDASDADRTAATRHELEAALTTLFTQAADAIVTIDADQRIMMFNHAAEQLFGCPAGEALGANASRFIAEQLLAPDPDHERRVAETGVAGWRLGEITPLTALHSDGQRIPIDANHRAVPARRPPRNTLL